MNKSFKISKLGIAKIQLERAIVLMLDEKDYISAITLAGASDEILGDMLPESQSMYDQLKSGFFKLSRRHGRSPTDKGFNELANGVRNGLKHYRDGADLEFDAESEAAALLDRAVSNLWLLTQEETNNMELFKQYHARRGALG